MITPLTEPLFVSDLLTGSGCRICDPARRAISLDQLGLVGKHIHRRLTDDGEVWQVRRWEDGKISQVDLTDPQAVTLYDANDKIIRPATEQQQVSFVELVADGQQVPDYFTDPWYFTARLEIGADSCCNKVGPDGDGYETMS